MKERRQPRGIGLRLPLRAWHVSELPERDLPAIPPVFRQDILNGSWSIIEAGVSTRLSVPREECIGFERQAVWSEGRVNRDCRIMTRGNRTCGWRLRE